MVAIATLQTIWDCRWSRLGYRVWGCRTTCNPKSSGCAFAAGEREGVTEEVCEACPHWESLPEPPRGMDERGVR